NRLGKAAESACRQPGGRHPLVLRASLETQTGFGGPHALIQRRYDRTEQTVRREFDGDRSVEVTSQLLLQKARAKPFPVRWSHHRASAFLPEDGERGGRACRPVHVNGSRLV